MTVHILTIEWRNWSRDIYAFKDRSEAEHRAIVLTETETIEEAQDSEQNGGHSVYIDTLEVE